MRYCTESSICVHIANWWAGPDKGRNRREAAAPASLDLLSEEATLVICRFFVKREPNYKNRPSLT